jgi:quercetin dioxygenase-like cupin family protein
MKTITIDRSKAIQQASSPDDHFEGNVLLQRMTSTPADGDIEFLAVYFGPGARNKPHIHQRDQYLQIMEGKGVVVTDKERRVVSAGDLVVIPGGAWHWHGATHDSAMMHLSIRTSGDSRWDVDQRDWATAKG